MDFKEAVETTPNLKGKWRVGLNALRAEDKQHVSFEQTNSEHLRGSVDVDTALLESEPNANRWDFAIGYKHHNRREEFVYWVETHTGSDSEIKVVLRKLNWLLKWLRKDGKELAGFDRQFVWVPSGATSFSKGSTQVRQLAEKGLYYSGSKLRVPVVHKEAKP